MMLDFEQFKRTIMIAFRKAETWYTLEDVIKIFRYYFETYEYMQRTAHPWIKLEQVQRIINAMPYVKKVYGTNGAFDIEPDGSMPDDEYMSIEPEWYPDMIDRHFCTPYEKCDFNINHFFSGSIRELRLYEVLNSQE